MPTGKIDMSRTQICRKTLIRFAKDDFLESWGSEVFIWLGVVFLKFRLFRRLAWLNGPSVGFEPTHRRGIDAVEKPWGGKMTPGINLWGVWGWAPQLFHIDIKLSV